MPFPYSSTGLDEFSGGGKYPPIPDDFYEFKITDVKEKETKNGDPMVNITLEVVSAQHTGRLIFHNVTFPKIDPATGKRPDWAGMSIHFLKTIDEPWEKDFIVTPDAWIGKQFRAKTKTTEYQGKKKNEIAFIPSKDEVNDDTVPF